MSGSAAGVVERLETATRRFDTSNPETAKDVASAAYWVEQTPWTAGRVRSLSGQDGPSHVRALAAAFGRLSEFEQSPASIQARDLRSQVQSAESTLGDLTERLQEYERAVIRVLGRVGPSTEGRGEYEASPSGTYRRNAFLLIGDDDALGLYVGGRTLFAYLRPGGTRPMEISVRGYGGTRTRVEDVPVYYYEGSVQEITAVWTRAQADLREIQASLSQADAYLESQRQTAETDLVRVVTPHVEALRAR